MMLNYEAKNIGNLDYNLTVFKCAHCAKSYFSLERLSLHVEENHASVQQKTTCENESQSNSDATAEIKQEDDHIHTPRLYKKYLKRMIKHWPPENAMVHWKKRFPDVNWKRRLRRLISQKYDPKMHDGVAVGSILESAYIQYTTPSLEELRSLEEQTGLSIYSLRFWFLMKHSRNPMHKTQRKNNSILLDQFNKTTYPSEEMLKLLATQTNMEYPLINTWFIMQRAKSNSMEFKEVKEKKLWVWFLPRASEVPAMSEEQMTDISSEVDIPTSEIKKIFNFWIGHLSKLKNFIDHGDEDDHSADQFNGKGISYQTMVLTALNKFREEQKSYGIPTPGKVKMRKGFTMPTVFYVQDAEPADWDSFTTYVEDRNKYKRKTNYRKKAKKKLRNIQKLKRKMQKDDGDNLMNLFGTSGQSRPSASKDDNNMLLDADMVRSTCIWRELSSLIPQGSCGMALKVQGSVLEKPKSQSRTEIDPASNNLFYLFTSNEEYEEVDDIPEHEIHRYSSGQYCDDDAAVTCFSAIIQRGYPTSLKLQEYDSSDDDVIFVREIPATGFPQANFTTKTEPDQEMVTMDHSTESNCNDINISVGLFNEMELRAAKTTPVQCLPSHEDETDIKMGQGDTRDGESNINCLRNTPVLEELITSSPRPVFNRDVGKYYESDDEPMLEIDEGSRDDFETNKEISTTTKNICGSSLEGGHSQDEPHCSKHHCTGTETDTTTKKTCAKSAGNSYYSDTPTTASYFSLKQQQASSSTDYMPTSSDDEVSLDHFKRYYNLHGRKKLHDAATSKPLHFLSIDELSPPPGSTKLKRRNKKQSNPKQNLKIKMQFLHKMQKKR